MSGISSPLELVTKFGLRPDASQLEMMERFDRGENPLDVRSCKHGELVRATAIISLWRMLHVTGSRISVLADEPARAREFMGFLHTVTTSINPVFAAACKWPRWSYLKIGVDAAVCKYVPNRPSSAAGLCWSDAHTIVILGAGSSEPAFVETVRALEPCFGAENCRVIRIW